MAFTAAPTVLFCSDMHLSVLLVEDNTASAVRQYDVLAALVASGRPVTGPMYLALNNGGAPFAAQANAQAAAAASLQITSTTRIAATEGGAATAKPVLVCIPNIAGGGVGNFRLDLSSRKVDNVAAGDTATFVLDIKFLHSIER